MYMAPWLSGLYCCRRWEMCGKKDMNQVVASNHGSFISKDAEFFFTWFLFDLSVLSQPWCCVHYEGALMLSIPGYNVNSQPFSNL